VFKPWRIVNNPCNAGSLINVPVKELWKSLNVLWGYEVIKLGNLHFGPPSVCCRYLCSLRRRLNRVFPCYWYSLQFKCVLLSPAAQIEPPLHCLKSHECLQRLTAHSDVIQLRKSSLSLSLSTFRECYRGVASHCDTEPRKPHRWATADSNWWCLPCQQLYHWCDNPAANVMSASHSLRHPHDALPRYQFHYEGA